MTNKDPFLAQSQKSKDNDTYDIDVGFEFSDSDRIKVSNLSVEGKVRTGFVFKNISSSEFNGLSVRPDRTRLDALNLICKLSEQNDYTCDEIVVLLKGLSGDIDKNEAKLKYNRVVELLKIPLDILTPFAPIISSIAQRLLEAAKR